ncbi:hypothetical protein A0J61_10996 [Choanephora cucurbitarum]|uniref:Uncharacterized protein n=1 Tax=Choanephora cucurbitarum TaxID=101091 RepID=A0A1C7MVM2_9FUNG|nr:hypothetical protein A0J61_10996 [Choanephora cucurbitarum]
MSKAIIHDPKIINIVITTLSNTQNDYLVGNPEWNNGTRSDVVLEAKPSVLNLPPIIIEIQHTVNRLFMKRVINYSLEAFNRHKLNPIVLIICTDTLSDSVAKEVKTRDIPACYDFPSTGWASDCLIVCKRRVLEYTDTMPLNPFIPLTLFLTSRELTRNCLIYQDDPTMQYLYTLVSHFHQNRLGDQHITDILAQVLDTQDHEHTKLLELVDQNSSPKTVAKAIKNLQSQNYAMKRKYTDVDLWPSFIPTNISTTAATATAAADPTISEDIDFTLESVTLYERGMIFAENYKHTRMQKGFKRMDWSACYSKGIELKLFKYKSADILRNQFNKYIKNKKKKCQ